jgi:transcriptional regulator with XRE-family HTH domain
MTGIVGVEELGRRIRKLRVERRMTLKQVEQACGLSATHLSEIERGRTSPTVGALVRIARALEKDASYFIEAEERADEAFVAREQARVVSRPGEVRIEALTPGVPGSGLFAYRLTLAGPAGDGLALAAQDVPGDAIYYVRRGTLQASFDGGRVTLSEGDAVQASFLVSHRLAPVEGSSAEVIAVLTRSLGER